MSVVFYKMTGSGNDFVMLDGRSTTPDEWSEQRIVSICDRRDGIGADGLIFVTPEDAGAARMTFFNNDGSRAPMCGNGALCSTRLATELEMTDAAGMTLITEAGPFRTRCVGTGELAELNLPDTPAPIAVDITPLDGEEWVGVGTVGVPHLVVVVADVAKVDLVTRGSELRFHPALGAGGANVNFVSRLPDAVIPDPAAPTWAIRTYERGVEGETLACGTGTVASGLAIAQLGLDQLPRRFRSSSGRVLSVNASIADGIATNIWLCGEGRLVAKGVWLG